MQHDTRAETLVAPSGEGLRRLFAPRHVAVFGGSAAAEVVRQCRALGFGGAIWPVHPRHEQVEGYTCFADVASLPELVDDGATGFVVPPNDAAAIGAKIAFLRANPAAAEDMGRRARASVLDRFTWPAVAAGCLDAYDARPVGGATPAGEATAP